MKFFIKTNRFIKWLFSDYIWDLPSNEKRIYITFDDGPIPIITPWVLNQLSEFNAKATFFCIGENIQKYPEIFEEIIRAGHSVGNHTCNHLKGWNTNTNIYIDNFKKCDKEIQKNDYKSLLFRPPYGKIKRSQAKIIQKLGFKIIMWDVISMDFDKNVSQENCLRNVTENATSGSIIIFHDSEKAFKNLEYVLPKTLKFFSENGYEFGSLI